MLISKYGEDWITLDESNLGFSKERDKVHLIKLQFQAPSEEIVEEVLERFPSTNRFIIEDNIKFYNYCLKNRKKYYVENSTKTSLISFFKKNNKVLLNFHRLKGIDRDFVISNIDDVLRNVEVVFLGEDMFQNIEQELKHWNGNVLIQ